MLYWKNYMYVFYIDIFEFNGEFYWIFVWGDFFFNFMFKHENKPGNYYSGEMYMVKCATDDSVDYPSTSLLCYRFMSQTCRVMGLVQ